MLNEFCAIWNSIFPSHQSTYHVGSAIINESGLSAKNKSLEINCSEALSFPSKQFDGYDLFGSLTNKNCDGVLLIKNEDSTYDFVYVEMKSRFNTDDVDKAKLQIEETRVKMLSLLRMIKKFSAFTLNRIFGIIETRELDDNQIVWWSKQSLLPEELMCFGERLLKQTIIDAPIVGKSNLRIPTEMKFRLVLSDRPHYSVNYGDIRY